MVKVPAKTSRYSHEPKPEKYVIPFAPELTDLIKSGDKLKTYRFGNKYKYLKVGDKLKLQNWQTKKIISHAIVTNISEISFKDIPLDVDGHETYKSKKHQRKVMSGYYAYLGREIQDDDLFLVI